ncbi:hypothetical protein [Limosilactobacillus fermentum]
MDVQHALESHPSINGMCDYVGISRSGYYQREKRHNHRESFGRSLFKVKLKQFGSKAFVFTVPAKSPKNFAQKDIRSLNELLVSICVNLAFTPFT